MRQAFVTVIFLFLLASVSAQTRPKIGVTLSGGGAKGLAHIGILKAIDSAGLKVNYVTGTSMGSIIGALYACGYSADTIEKMARNTDWDLLLSNASSLRSLSIDEKDEYDKYAVELPWVNNAFQLPSGVFESEELWLRFSEYFFPVYNIKDFSKFPKAFKCIATDVATGEPVVMDSGEIVSAVRSSMAIPTVFTAVNYNGRKFIDGGVTRNFPVKDAKKMGADIVIGSNVAGGLLPKEKINNVFQVLLQVAFFREDADVAEEKKLCNIYVKHDLQNFSMGSFASANEIIKEGIKKGDSIYPRVKEITDSLNAIYGVQKYKVNNIPKVDSVYITAYKINGLKNTNESFFMHRMEFEVNRWYKATDITACIRKAFGTRYYSRITYSLQPLQEGSCKIIFDVDENPLSFGKLGVHYNTFAGISLIGNITTRDFFTPYSRSLVTANIGENLRIKGEHLQYFGKFKTLSLETTVQGESLKFTTYNNFNKDGVYKRSYLVADINSHWNIKRKYSFGIGTRFEAFHYKPDIPSKLEVRGSNNLFNSYVSLRLNTLSNAIYPKRGSKVDIEAGYVYSQHPDLDFYSYGNPIANTDSLGFNFNNFIKTKLNYEHYFRLSHNYTFLTQLQAGINFDQRESVLNDFYIGGLDRTFRDQITFAGLNEGTVLSSSAASLMLGLRYQMFNNVFLTAKTNILYNNFIGSNKKPQTSGWLTGYAVTLGYNFVLGPLEISAMYCDQSKKLLPYINLGIPF